MNIGGVTVNEHARKGRRTPATSSTLSEKEASIGGDSEEVAAAHLQRKGAVLRPSLFLFPGAKRSGQPRPGKHRRSSYDK